MTKSPNSSHVNTNKVVKNQLKVRAQPIKSKVVKHFEPHQSKLPWQRQVTQGIPEIDNNVDNKFATTPTPKQSRSPRIIQRSGLKLNNLEKKTAAELRTSSIPQKPVKPAEEKSIIPPRFAKRLQSSSSSSFVSTPRKKNVTSKSFHSRPSSNLATKPGGHIINKTFITGPNRTYQKVQGGDFSSSTDSALMQKNTNQRLHSLKNEILTNKRIRKFDELTNIHDDRDDAQYGDLKNEIVRNRMEDVRRRKLWISELKTEIEQFKRFDNFEVYTLHQTNPNKFPEYDDGNSSGDEIAAVDLDCDPGACEEGCGNSFPNTTDDEDKGVNLT